MNLTGKTREFPSNYKKTPYLPKNIFLKTYFGLSNTVFHARSPSRLLNKGDYQQTPKLP